MALISDQVTSRGFLTPITPKGMTYHQAGPTAQMAYEQPKKYIKNATVFGVEDPLNNTSALITVNRKINAGTGIVTIESDPQREEELLLEIRKRNVTFNRSQTSNIIQGMLDLDKPEELAPISVDIIQPTIIAEEFIPPDVDMTFGMSLDAISMMSLDPIASPELLAVNEELSGLPIVLPAARRCFLFLRLFFRFWPVGDFHLVDEQLGDVWFRADLSDGPHEVL
jgi:hypothetical protein